LSCRIFESKLRYIDANTASEGSRLIQVRRHPQGRQVHVDAGEDATSWLGSADIFIGVNALDYSGYPDCRPEYIEAFEHLANLATKAGVEERSRFRVRMPLVALGKADIVRHAAKLGVDFAMTWSCYAPRADDRPCGVCDSCILRAKGFAEAGVQDPLTAAR